MIHTLECNGLPTYDGLKREMGEICGQPGARDAREQGCVGVGPARLAGPTPTHPCNLVRRGGSTMTVVREDPEANANGQRAAVAAEPWPHVRRILIAEDNSQLRGQLQEVLSAENGVTVDTTGDGQEALDILTNSDRKYSIFLTDLKL